MVRAMFDSKPMRAQIQSAAARFAERLASLYARELSRITTQFAVAESAAGKAAPAAAKTERKARPAAAREESTRRHLIVQRTGGPKIIPVPRGSQIPPRGAEADLDPSLRLPQGPSAESVERVRNRVTRLVLGSAEGFTLDQMSAHLRLTLERITPVVEQLVAENSLRVIQSEGSTIYRRPRVEPIRRKRDDSGNGPPSSSSPAV